MPKYYKILDKNIIGRQDSMFDCYIYDSKKGWVWDKDRILMDRIIGYDGDSIGSTDMMLRIEQISEKEALELIEKL